MFPRESPIAEQLRNQLKQKLARRETAWLVGLGVHGHNAGAALVEVSPRTGLRLISNDEEERFRGIKHFSGYPEQAVHSLKRRLDGLGLTGDDVSAFVTSWDYSRMGPFGVRVLFEHFPASFGLARSGSTPKFAVRGAVRAAGRAPGLLAQQLGMRSPPDLVMLPHHDNHAAFSFAASPFRHSDRPVIVSVLDGFGDEGAISLYVGQHGRLRRTYQNDSIFDSLGLFYSVLSSTQGGWTTLSSEGRYMGAVAWGDMDRLTNPYYRRLRQLFHFGPEGQIHVNRDYANWFCEGELQPYKRTLTDIIGEPIAPERMWNPDAILRVEDVEHSPVTRDRVDVAAATQLVFEDVLFHVVDHLIRSTRSDQLVLTGGTALNCLANMRLLERFDREWYRRNLRQETELKIWVPPTPGDAGVTIGAAYQFALDCGVPPGEPLQHAFYCGLPPTTDEIGEALETTPEIAFQSLGSIATRDGIREVADFMAFVVSRDGVLGVFQSSAETGPRALGHRSILANPCNPNTLENINSRVKFREPIRPLAPMATLEAANRYFHLAPGASADDFTAYNYMVLTAEARPEAYAVIPAVVHRDGTARVQIVRRDIDPLMHVYLKAMGRHVGVEVSVNTSLNVGTPIVQTPAQALDALKRAKALSGLVLVSDDGEAFLAWHDVTVSPKDGGQRLLEWHREWQRCTVERASLPASARLDQ